MNFDPDVGDVDHPTARKWCENIGDHARHNHYDSEELAWYQCLGIGRCRYITSLDRECGRPATIGDHCDLHALLTQLDAIDFREDETTIAVPASLKHVADRILSDVQANFDAMPRIGYLLGLTHTSMNRREDLRIMRGNDQ